MGSHIYNVHERYSDEEITHKKSACLQCTKHMAPIHHDLVNVKNSKYAFRYSNILDVPQVRTTRYGKKLFMFAAATLWNDLPNHFRTENSFNHFKSLIQSWNGSVCRCSACR